MIKIIGVRFRGSGKIYYFDPAGLELSSGDHVIAQTARGLEMGTVAGTVREVPDDYLSTPLKTLVRIANEEDEKAAQQSRQGEKEAIAVCKERIRARNLEMKLIDAEYTFDHSKILFYFTADGRVDFRELVKDLAAIFRTRIELRQIGVRDETRILGGIGICGRPLCCSSYLTDFVPVSIRMAKEQNLSLNPTKISGACGRLMCCLKNEEATYAFLNKKLPAVGEIITTPGGNTGKVQSVSVLRQKVKVVIEENDEKEIHEYDAADLTFNRRKGKEIPAELPEEEEQVLPAGKENRERDVQSSRSGKRKKGGKQKSAKENRET